jgi:hypothetical protein
MSNFSLTKPQHWRKGQVLFNFFQWLATEKGFDTIPANRVGESKG